MGIKNTYKCNKCNYTVLTSAGKDRGFIAVVDTFICKRCNNIVVVCVGEEGETYKRRDVLFKRMKTKHKLDFFSCPICSSKTDLVKWKTRLRPCPKCDGKMEFDSEGEQILWD